MKSVLVIGLGRFGWYTAVRFAEHGNEVMAVDISEKKVNEILPKITNGQIGDCMNEAVLRSLGVWNFDICVVAIGSNFQASLEITLLLKELGAKYIISKASQEIQAKFLMRSGADEVVYPERQTAEKIAVKHSSDNVFDFIELTPDYSIFEIRPMEAWIGKTIEQVGVRRKYGVSILATKENGVIYPLPKADYTFKESEHLIIFGKKEETSQFTV